MGVRVFKVQVSVKVGVKVGVKVLDMPSDVNEARVWHGLKIEG